jgi:peroxiredoxin
VNDGAVMDAWAKDQGVAGSEFITLMGDMEGLLTKQIGMVMNHPGPNALFGTSTPRSKRVAMYLVDGVVKIVRVAEGPGPKGEEDPAGDDFPEVTLAPAMMDAIAAFNSAQAKGEL